MANPLYHCSGCNESFAVAGDDPVCPQCGASLETSVHDVTEPWLDRTQLTASPVRIATGGDDKLLGTVLGDYRLDETIGQGGMARVYRATHLLLDRPCAVKILHPELIERHPEFVEMFFHEARSAAALIHPHVVTIHSIGEYAGRHYIEMEYILGHSLWSLRRAQQKMPVDEATRLIMETCAGLAEAHRRDIIHRDLKPANVLVTADRRAKLADFGLAKQVDPSGKRRGKLMGTPHFMAPELFSDAAANRRSDIYALGATFYYLLTGKMPFSAAELEELARLHAEAPLPDPRQHAPALPEEIVEFLNSCLAKLPDGRFCDAAEAYEELRRVFGNQRSLARLVKEALADDEYEIRVEGEQFAVTVRLPGERSQRIVIETTVGAESDEALVRIYSICGPYRAEYMQRALELNARMEHGSIAVQKIDGEPYFIMVNNYPRATCDPEEIRHSVLEIARWADEVEDDLTAKDEH